MSQKTRKELRGQFRTGARPTEQDYADRADSNINQLDDNVHVDHEKNIGIGTDAPQAKLHVNGGTQIDENLKVGGNVVIDGDAVIKGKLSSGNSSGKLEINDAVQIEESLSVSGDVTMGDSADDQVVVKGKLYTEQQVGDKTVLVSSRLVGEVKVFATPNVPKGYLACDGSEQSSTDYPELANALDGIYNKGDEQPGKFRLPDLRGEFIRGWSNGRDGVDENREFGSEQGDCFKRHKHGIKLSHEGNQGTRDESGFPIVDSSSLAKHGSTESDSSVCKKDGSGSPLYSEGENETRPQNIALLYCIKY